MADKIEWNPNGTPGPWGIEVYSRTSLAVHDYRHDWRVCFMATPSENGEMAKIETNARAIAEVPAMVQALREFVEIPYAFDLYYKQQKARAILARIDGEA